jgi:predicted DNA-binding protein (MmcQ/YjbR family)
MLMDLESFRAYCLSLRGVTESLPFGPDTLVFKVSGKMFALASLDTEELSVNLKCDPEMAISLREQYDFVKPGYHMNKQHWNTVTGQRGLTEALLKQWINHSYDLIVSALPKKIQQELLSSESP